MENWSFSEEEEKFLEEFCGKIGFSASGRPILFRGKGGLGSAIGSLVIYRHGLNESLYMIWDGCSYLPVDPKSVGQLVGQYNGQNIFEGDIVKVTETDGWKSTYTGKVVYDKMNCRFVVEVTNPYPMIIPITGEKQIDQIGMGCYCEYYYQYEVIGNEYEERLKKSNP